MMEDQGSVLVLYGTETGNSQDYAQLVAKKCQRLRIDVKVRAMDDCTLLDLVSFKVLIFVCSTTGQGELPRNAKKLWKQMLRRKLPPTFLFGVHFTTFGLGDSSYPRYNWAIKKIHRRVAQLGAKELSPRGEGDEQSAEGVDENFDAWVNIVAKHLRELFPLESGVQELDESTLLDPRYTITLLRDRLKHGPDTVKSINMTRSDVNKATIKRNDRITAQDHFQDVRHLQFESTDSDLSYVPGDTVALYPANNWDEVDLFIKHQKLTEVADFPVEVNEEFANAVPGGLVHPLTIRSLLLYHLDLVTIPRRSFFASVWHFASDERERERLQEFSTLEGLEDLFDYANRPRRSILETVLEFDSLQIPVEYLLDVIPILHPRLFSIASPEDQSNADGPLNVELAVAIVKYKTILRRIRRGVCTRWIEGLRPGDAIPFTLHKSPLALNQELPAVLIGPGTGVAPIRSLVLTRHAQSAIGKMVLFFGCRFKDKDYIFEDDWEAPTKSGQLEVVTAFSRQNGGYVQNRLFEKRKDIGDLIVNHNASVYLCGSSGRMPREVRITIVEIVKQALTDGDAEEYVKKMENEGRYLQETWS
uniref:NADPH-dependent diflavin oxidoreductase 1 n=1 Tax=Blastobotrys adeninivorans TaxID=409370 RepID=A0A060T714_BLAAD